MMDTSSAIILDARELEHPLPLNRAVKILRTLKPNRYLWMIHRKEPVPLLELARAQGFWTHSKQIDEHTWHILIARNNLFESKELADVYK